MLRTNGHTFFLKIQVGDLNGVAQHFVFFIFPLDCLPFQCTSLPKPSKGFLYFPLSLSLSLSLSHIRKLRTIKTQGGGYQKKKAEAVYTYASYDS